MNSVRTFNGVLYTFQSQRDAQKAVTIFIDNSVFDEALSQDELEDLFVQSNIEYITGNIA